MSKIHLIYLIFFQLLVLSSLSQSTTKYLDIGDQYFNNRDYVGANFYYEKALKIDSSDSEVLYKYAKSLSELNKNEKASRYFFKCSLIDRGQKFPDCYYLLAETYRVSGDYKKARRYYSKALIPYRSNRKSYWYKRVKQSKDANSWALKQKTEKDFKVTNIGPSINSKATEFGGRIYNNTLFYSSLRADTINTDGSINDNHYYTRIYAQELIKGKDAIEVKVKSEKSDELKNKHLANISLHPNSSVAFFSVCDSNYNCQIWKGSFDLKKMQISGAIPLNNNINNPSANNTQAQAILYEKEEYLLFVSDRERGFGELDLWLSKLEGFGYDKPINLGKGVNSEGNEITPFYHDKSKTLFFSSDWHFGYGGYDNFKVQGDLKNPKSIENLSKPINSSLDEYYFFAKENKALISSNRTENNTKGSENCCNDLFIFDYIIEDAEQEIDLDTIPVIEDVVSLNKYLPLNLYFHNDSPDPRSRDTLTKENYKDLAESYLSLEEEYIDALKNSSNYAMDDVGLNEILDFFESEIPNGVEDLEFFTPLLYQELEKGSKIQLSIKGFASSLFSSDYNLNLTLRRIQSLINYFYEYEDGILKPYLDGNAKNGGSLKIQKLPYGEFASISSLSESDTINAIYSKTAAEQRKIEMIAIKELADGMSSFDNNSKYRAAEISFNSKNYDLGKINVDAINRFFVVSNKGGQELQIYNVIDNCNCTEIEYPKEIQEGKNAKIQIKMNTKDLKGKYSIQFTVVSNTQPNISQLELNFEK